MATSQADKATERARQRAEFRKSVVDASTEGQVRIVRERARQRRSVEKIKTTQRVSERQQSEAARVQAYQERSRIALQQKAGQQQQRVQTQKDLNSIQRREKVTTQVIGSATGTSAWSTFMMLTTLFFAMILIYVIVTNGKAFGNLTGTAGQWIAGISSNKPLFVRV